MRHKLVYKNSASFIYKRIYVSALVVTVKPSARFVRFVLGNVGMAIIFHFTFTETHFQSTSVGCVYIYMFARRNLQHPSLMPFRMHTSLLYNLHTFTHAHEIIFAFIHSYTTSACIPICIYTYRHITSMAAMQNLSYLFALSLSLSCHA